MDDEIGSVFEKWNEDGELRGTYLVQIGSEVCRRRKTKESGKKGEGSGKSGHVLDDVLDKVVQDDDDTEGTGYWSAMETVDRHVSAPSIAAAQFLRVASGNRAQRVKDADKLMMPEPKVVKLEGKEKAEFIEDLRLAVYASILASFCQGLELIARASKDEGWNVDPANCIRIWRAGCIIQCDYIADMLEPILAANSKGSASTDALKIFLGSVVY
jgi:6-phosphogluconate dehydrogenase